MRRVRLNYFHPKEAMKQKLLTLFIVIMLFILATEVKVLYDLRHQPTIPRAGMVVQPEVESYVVQNHPCGHITGA